MSARAFDARGQEYDLPIAKEETVLVDDAGVPRKILAGQPVPLDLLDAYKAASGSDADSKADASESGKDDEAAEGERQSARSKTSRAQSSDK